MRKMLLTVALAAALVLPALAQFRPGGFGGGQQGGDSLLTNKSVQKELKLTDDQTKALAEITAKQDEARKEAFPLFKDDQEKAQEILKKSREVAAEGLKKVRTGLTSEQAKRFSQIEIQVAAKNKDIAIFKNEAVVKLLSITSEQSEKIKEAAEGVAKDSKELLDDAKGDRKKGAEAFKKVGELRGEAFDKVVKMLSADQKKAWDDGQGEKFEYKSDFGGFGKEKGKGKDKKKDDF